MKINISIFPWIYQSQELNASSKQYLYKPAPLDKEVWRNITFQVIWLNLDWVASLLSLFLYESCTSFFSVAVVVQSRVTFRKDSCLTSFSRTSSFLSIKFLPFHSLRQSDEKVALFLYAWLTHCLDSKVEKKKTRENFKHQRQGSRGIT